MGERTGPEALVADATARVDAALLLAAARAGVPLPAEAATVAGVAADGTVVHVASAHDRAVPAADPDHAPGPDGPYPPPDPITPTVAQTLLVVLALCSVDGHVYPGRATTRDTVAGVFVRHGRSAAFARGGLVTLAVLGYVTLDGDSVRPGPRLAGWDDRFTRQDLPQLTARVRR